jgi:transcriptional regulator with XRE-family HTH domain
MARVKLSTQSWILEPMQGPRTQRTFAEELPELLRERELSLRTLARVVGVGDDHLSRVLRGARSKRVTGELASRVAVALGLPEDYFPETRLEFIVRNLSRHPTLRDRVYDELRQVQA